MTMMANVKLNMCSSVSGDGGSSDDYGDSSNGPQQSS